MIREIRLWWRARPYIKRLKEVKNMRFTSRVQMILHVLTILAGLGVAVSDLLPEEYRIWVLAFTGAIQAFLGKAGTKYNPDGTPASVGYEKEEK